MKFRIVKAISYLGETYLPGDETRLFSKNPSLIELTYAIENNFIVPLVKDDQWYVGPHKKIFYEQKYYTDKSVYSAVHDTETSVKGIGAARLKDVLDYFTTKQSF